MSHSYNHDWHQCRNCGCTRPDTTMLHFGVVDAVLKLTSDVYECKDRPLCDRLKKGRKETLDRELGLDPAQPIRQRKARR